jgi:hypothetical protein
MSNILRMLKNTSDKEFENLMDKRKNLTGIGVEN